MCYILGLSYLAIYYSFLQREEEAAKSLEKKISVSKSVQESSVSKGRSYSVSLALPGSILDNAQSPELRSYLAGQIARALAVFNVDEVVVFDDEGKSGGGGDGRGQSETTTEGEFTGVGKHGKGCLQLARILQYLECPQYLRKHFFPIHADLKYAGILNPTDMPHHLRASEDSAYREGVVLDRPPAKRGSIVSVGRNKDVVIDKRLSPGIRVTVELEQDEFATSSKLADGKVVAPDVPRKEAGLYWGYTVRLAENLSSVFAKVGMRMTSLFFEKRLTTVTPTSSHRIREVTTTPSALRSGERHWTIAA